MERSREYKRGSGDGRDLAKVLNALNSGEMPPEDEPQIPNVEKTGLLDDLSNQLAEARKILSDSGGKITIAASIVANTKIPCRNCWESKSM